MTLREEIYKRIDEERARQDRLHGPHNASLSPLDFEWIGILAEELGEASQALQYLRRNIGAGIETVELGAYISELLQVAACAVQTIEVIEAAAEELIRQ